MSGVCVDTTYKKGEVNTTYKKGEVNTTCKKGEVNTTYKGEVNTTLWGTKPVQPSLRNQVDTNLWEFQSTNLVRPPPLA